MKKLLILLLAFSMIFGSFSFAKQSEEENKKMKEDMAIISATTANESENNNTFSAADTLNNDVSTYGYISEVTDVDYFKITFSQNTYANFWLDVPTGKNYNLYVYDKNQILKWSSTNATGIDELLSQKAVLKGSVYYIKVVPSDLTQCSTTSYYILKVRQLTPTEYYGVQGWGYMYSSTYDRHISSGYKLSDRPTHFGFDIVSSSSSDPILGDAIKNVYGGKVILSVENNPSAGNYVVVETNSSDPSTDKKLKVRYLHMRNKPSVAIGSIAKGTIVGYTGSTGESTGPHLHFDVNKSGLNSGIGASDSVNPQKFFPSITFSGKTSTLD